MNSIGMLFRTTIFGESHGEKIGVVIDGVPHGILFSEQTMLADLDRRRAGAKGTTTRKESDIPHIVSGVFEGYTTGAPLTIMFDNENTRSGDYNNPMNHPRPGHADFTANRKFEGFADYRGGGHFSGRITLGLVAAGVLAKKIASLHGIDISSSILEIGSQSDSSKWDEVVENAMAQSDSVGGIIECRISGVPIGLGEPFFNSVESLISHAVFSIPAIRGIEFGDGFAAAAMRGSEHNDLIVSQSGEFATNHAGGINGGITNGNDIVFRVAVKPTPSIASKQMTYDFEKDSIEEMRIKGRHDACIALRVPVIVEAVAAAVIADLLLVCNNEI